MEQVQHGEVHCVILHSQLLGCSMCEVRAECQFSSCTDGSDTIELLAVPSLDKHVMVLPGTQRFKNRS